MSLLDKWTWNHHKSQYDEEGHAAGGRQRRDLDWDEVDSRLPHKDLMADGAALGKAPALLWERFDLNLDL